MILAVIFLFCSLVTTGTCDPTGLNCGENCCIILLVMIVLVTMSLTVNVGAVCRPLILQSMEKVLSPDVMKKELKTHYRHILEREDFTSLGSSSCYYFKDFKKKNTCYEDFLCETEQRRLLFISNNPISRYILQQWSEGNILSDKIMIYINESEEDCVLEVLIDKMRVKFPKVKTTDILKILIERKSIVLLEDCNSFTSDQIIKRTESRIRFYDLLKNNFQALPTMSVWATSRKSENGYAFTEPDCQIYDVTNDQSQERHDLQSLL